jgi:speckle-type POZ protein
MDPCREIADFTSELQEFFRNSHFTDFTLIANNGRPFPTYRCILMARSEVFRSMLTHDTKENAEKSCRIDDVDEETLEALLKYLSGCPLEGNFKVAEKLLAAADKYCIKSLAAACENHLMSKISADNAARLLILADMHSATGLKVAVLRFAAHSLPDIGSCGGMTELANYGHGLLDQLVTFVCTKNNPQ